MRRRLADLATWVFVASYGVGVFALWEFLVVALHVPTYILPRPSHVALLIVQRAGLLIDHSGVTLLEILIGFLLGSILGVAFSVAIHLVEVLRRTILPTLVAFQAVPKAALGPLVIVWFGLGMTAKVLMVVFFCFFPVLINMLGGLERVEPAVLDLMSVLRANRWQTFVKVALPAALPALFDGLRIAMPLAVVGAVIGEFLSAERGLGHLILVASAQVDMPLMVAALAALTVMAVILFSALRLVESVAVPWSAERRRKER